ncbi:Sbal_3080 family lipoprotein [Shewanella sp. AS1]|uniref:Sbal_3080 family lipoprotein n=1 Tax=Shewanella sp. AS1 TaxID=2907626 RepID=UPI001F38E178|nr:Sbal_3080 family lipoprotein [Shewanella sp. AS1]MCE9678510.1 Sbal_3080 family lipoprotein [Shewanella sp. AS1]
MFRKISLILTALLLTGCANNAIVELQKADSNSLKNKTIEIIDDGRTKNSIKYVITSKLNDYGFQYQVVDISVANAKDTDNPKLTYSANWWWDVASYMRYLNIEIKDQDKTIALVKIDTVKCGGYDKFGSAQERTEISLELLLSDLSKEEANELICLGRKPIK